MYGRAPQSVRVFGLACGQTLILLPRINRRSVDYCSPLIQRLFIFHDAIYDSSNSYALLHKMLKIRYAIGEAVMHITTVCTPTAQWHHFSAPRTRTTCGVVPLRAQHIGNHGFTLVVSTCGARQRLRVASASSRCEQRDRWVRWNHGSCNGTILAPTAHVLARNAQNGSRWPHN